MGIDDLLIVSYPIHVREPSKEPSENHVWTFNAFVVLESQLTPVRPYSLIVEKLAKAINHEEVKASYLTLEMRCISETKESMPERDAFRQNGIQSALNSSDLARTLKEIFDGLRSCGQVCIQSFVSSVPLTAFRCTFASILGPLFPSCSTPSGMLATL